MKSESIHRSVYFYRLILGIGLSIIASIQLRFNLGLENIVLGLLALLTVAFLTPKSRLLITFLAGLLIGNLWSLGSLSYLKISQDLVGQRLTICGSADQDTAFDSRASLKLTKIRVNNRPFVGRALISLNKPAKIKRSNQICAIGRAKQAKFGYIFSLKSAKIISNDHQTDWFTKVRDSLAARFNRLTKPASAFGQALLLGNRFLIGSRQKDNIRTVGLPHIVVVSGFHLLVIVKLIRESAINSRRVKFWTTMAVASVFVLISGLSASLIRAWILLALSLTAWYYGRGFDHFKLFSLVMTTSLLINPLYALFDYSWLLSYSAFFAIIVVAPIIKQYFFADKLSKTADLILVIVLVQLSLLPLLSFLFGKISLIAPLVNLLVVPVVSLLMITLILLVLLTSIPLVGALVALVNQTLINYILLVINQAAAWPLAELNLRLDKTNLLAIYIVYGLFLIYFNWQNHRDRPYKIVDLLPKD